MDKTLKCRDCGAEFVFTEGEQTFFAAHGLLNAPGRCPQCRSQRKTQQRGGGSEEQAERRAPREMFPAVCAECGAETMLPFQPRLDRPVYCSSCFDRVRANR
jgi:CxxC-x17-CxxC domain-containing protein